MRSSASSSAIRIVIVLAFAFIGCHLFWLSDRQCDHKRRTLTGRAAGRDRAAVPFDDLAADGQADSRALVLRAAVKALENRENLVGVDLVEADPVIFDQDLTVRTGLSRSASWRALVSNDDCRP